MFSKMARWGGGGSFKFFKTYLSQIVIVGSL